MRCTHVYIDDLDLVTIVMYYGLGDIAISGHVTLTVDSDLIGGTFTCISTGGPATTVTWTRDNVTITEGTVTVLNDPETAQYTHTLTVTEILVGLYTCTVSNDKPSTASAIITVQGIQVAITCLSFLLASRCFHV